MVANNEEAIVTLRFRKGGPPVDVNIVDENGELIQEGQLTDFRASLALLEVLLAVRRALVPMPDDVSAG